MSDTSTATKPSSLAEIKANRSAMLPQADQAVDMFTERGFALAQRVANAFATSDAVPTQFRTHNLKKVGNEEHWVENPAAIGNCLVAIEVARAVGMSITAVMQNADMIQGKLRWSGKFVIAAINASGRFTPLRFAMRKLGPITAKYKEKTGWDNQARRPTFTERSVEVENVECIAWALPRDFRSPSGIYTLDQARAANLPVIESAPVTMKMVVEEGWYGKPDSKWQTEMRSLMFQYRAGSFFGNIHAPDIVMGMTRTSEEERDLAPTFDIDLDGRAVPVPVSELRPPAPGPVPTAEVVDPPASPVVEPTPAPPPGTWTPTPEEEAEIRAREVAEAAGDARGGEATPSPQQRTAARGRRVQTSME